MAHFVFMIMVLFGLGYMLYGANAYLMEEDARIHSEWSGACVENITRTKGIVEEASAEGIVVVFNTGVRDRYPETSLRKVDCD
jgi:hypothetical protein